MSEPDVSVQKPAAPVAAKAASSDRWFELGTLVVLLAAGTGAIALHERDIGLMLFSGALGFLSPRRAPPGTPIALAAIAFGASTALLS